MAELTSRGIKWFMISFNLLLFIFGIVLIALGAAAKAQYYDLSNYFDHNTGLGGTISPAALLIAVGVFIAALSFLGCFTAVKETYGLLVTFAVLLGILFIIQFAGAIAMYVQKDNMTRQVGPALSDMMKHYNASATQEGYNSTTTMDNLQKSWSCCGVNGYTDWYGQLKGVPQSCCIQPNCSGTSEGELTPVCGGKLPSCPVYIHGCKAPFENALEKGLKGVAGAGIAFAIIELIGLGFTAYLAKRIRSGYTYA
ncbi:hypothetical protein RvY_01190 [Ramazzottius varieornatus]|uniref:Tetraspanin n=1 Tax=Ramazzottius varieornatus TaxID=947166 RepID=A0A1D1UQ65_RAMVA|nr:hypothetical protein RvY_01190 [Ramazzottius varieornatus]